MSVMVDIAASAIGALARNVARVVIVIVISIVLFGVEGGPNPRHPSAHELRNS